MAASPDRSRIGCNRLSGVDIPSTRRACFVRPVLISNIRLKSRYRASFSAVVFTCPRNARCLYAPDVATSFRIAVLSSLRRHDSRRCRFAGRAFTSQGALAPSPRLGAVRCRVITFSGVAVKRPLKRNVLIANVLLQHLRSLSRPEGFGGITTK